MTLPMKPVPDWVGTVGGAVKVAPLAEPDVTEAGAMEPHWAPGAGVAPQGWGLPSESRLTVRPMESLVEFPNISDEVAVIVWVVPISMVVVEGVTLSLFAFAFGGALLQFEAKTTAVSVSNSRNELRFIA